MRLKTIIIALCLLLSIFISWQFIWPAYNNFQAKQSVADVKQQEYNKLKDLVDKLNELTKDYKTKADSVDKLEQIAPPGKNIPELLNQFESLSAQSGMILHSIDFAEGAGAQAQAKQTVSPDQAAAQQNEAASAPVNELGINIRVSGSYEAFKNFLTNIEKNLRLVDIQTLGFSVSGQQNDLYDYSVSGKAYYH
jgi:Tfp pilus assembly protein PilO